MTVLAELEKIDDDCDRHGIQFVKIDDAKAAREFGIDDVPSIVYFEKQIPNVYDGTNVWAWLLNFARFWFLRPKLTFDFLCQVNLKTRKKF